MNKKGIRQIIERINEIYYKKKKYPKLKITRPWSTTNKEITGELARPSAYSFYLERELENLLALGATISIVASRHITDPYDAKLLDYVDEYQMDIRKKKLFLFGPERTEISIERLRHYTGTEVEDFQSYILLTNYAMHMEIFAEMFPDCTKSAGHPQMPTYHHKAPDNQGITIVNIGVGPSNAKTFTDHVCVLKPEMMLMIGHCGGLRNNQQVGDFVLASSYYRNDKVLDEVLPSDIPVIPSYPLNALIIDELEKAMVEYRIGCVFTTADRNWELNKGLYMNKIALSRSVGIDMESATIAANGYRYRVPNATLLMVSDKPLHGKPKMSGDAKKFYQSSKKLHVELAVKIVARAEKEYPYGFPANMVRGLYDPLLVSL